MEYGFNYDTEVFGECASDYKTEDLDNDILKRFISWVRIFQDTITKSLLQIECYRAINYDIFLEKKSFKDFPVFLCLSISNICYFLVIELSNLLDDANDLNLYRLLSFCGVHDKEIFMNSVKPTIKGNRKTIKKIHTWYNEKIDDLRKKVYAHGDNKKLDYTFVKSLMENITISEFEDEFVLISKLLNDIWMNFKGNKLCFISKEKTNIKNVLEKLCL